MKSEAHRGKAKVGRVPASRARANAGRQGRAVGDSAGSSKARTNKGKGTASSKTSMKKSKNKFKTEHSRKSASRQRGGSTKPRTRSQWALAVVKWGAIVGFFAGAVGAVGLAAMFWYYGSDPNLPHIATLQDYRPAQVNRVETPDGKLIGEIFKQRRTRVTFEALPKDLVNAFVSAEDKGFWEHEGIDYLGMMRAALVNARAGKKKQGASTITQQVVKNLLLTPERSFRRKFQEIILARRLEKTLSKEAILMLYANEIYLGHGRYGVQEAARYYFGKEVSDLNLGEAALLAGLPKGPNRYSPKKKKNGERAKARQTYVLEEMMHNGYITVEQAQHWIDEPIEVVANATPEMGMAPEFVELAKAQLAESIGEEGLVASGATVVTTVDLKVQALARKALQDNLRRYDIRKGYGHAIKKLRANKIALELVRMSKRLPKRGPKKKGVYRAIVLRAYDQDAELQVDLGNYKASLLLSADRGTRYNPENRLATERFPRGSVIRVMLGAAPGGRAPRHGDRQVAFAPGPEGAVVVMDVKTRRLRAIIGGYAPTLAGFNRATMAKRQAGSTFKPLVYAAAIDSGDFTAASIVNDAPEVYDLWKPENYKKGRFAGPVRLRYALKKSINTVAIRVAHEIGLERIRVLARALGIQSDLPQGLSLALGSGEVSPLELTNAFASLAAGGVYVPPWSIESLGDTNFPPRQGSQVIRAEVAYVVVDMMRSVMTEGTGARAASLGLQLAGKTGTSNRARDAWFVGMSPDLVVGVWVGFDDFGQELGSHEGGSKTALPVFIDIMKQMGSRSSRFVAPLGLEILRIDKATGLLAPDDEFDGSYKEVFLEGSGPTEFAPRAQEVGVEDAILDQYGDLNEVATPLAPSASSVPVSP